jgi:hypothetical protein
MSFPVIKIILNFDLYFYYERLCQIHTKYWTGSTIRQT